MLKLIVRSLNTESTLCQDSCFTIVEKIIIRIIDSSFTNVTHSQVESCKKAQPPVGGGVFLRLNEGLH